MLTLRPLRWPEDREPLLALDTSFTTDSVYRVVASGLSFALEATPVAPSLRKVYDLSGEVDGLPGFERVIIAEVGGELAGMAALKYEAWNRRAVLWHLYIGPAHRGRGVGRALVDAAVAAARQFPARCLWLETQSVNYGAIQFYQRVGFRCCGLDTTLYDLGGAAEEAAVFFARPLP